MFSLCSKRCAATVSWRCLSCTASAPNLAFIKGCNGLITARQKQTERQRKLKRGGGSAVPAELILPSAVDGEQPLIPCIAIAFLTRSPSAPGAVTLKLIKILIQGESDRGIPHNKGKPRPIRKRLEKKRRFGHMTKFSPRSQRSEGVSG